MFSYSLNLTGEQDSAALGNAVYGLVSSKEFLTLLTGGNAAKAFSSGSKSKSQFNQILDFFTELIASEGP